MKKDARLSLRVPKELKKRLDYIEQIHGVALPKIANECLTAFCEYVENQSKTPTFPIIIAPAEAVTKQVIKKLREPLIHGMNEPEETYKLKKR